MSLEYTDETPMPFGKFKGTPLGRVPAHYLDWLIGQDLSRWPALEQYIIKNLNSIHDEIEDD